MSYHAEVEKAFTYVTANPPHMPNASDLPQSMSNVLATTTSTYAFLKDQPDENTLRFTPGSTLPNEVVAKTLDLTEFSSLVKECYEVIGNTPDSTWTQDVFEHESQHLDAARKLGAVGCKIGIALQLVPGTGNANLNYALQVSTRIGRLDTTKLGAALICSYPEDLSPGDLSDLTSMGYTDVDDVAERIISNKAFRYPLPLSYDLSSASWRLKARRFFS